MHITNLFKGNDLFKKLQIETELFKGKIEQKKKIIFLNFEKRIKSKNKNDIP